LNVTIGGNAFIRAVACFPAFQLINILRDQVTLNPVAGHERQALLEDLQFPERRKLVDHGEQLMLIGWFRAPVFKCHFVRQEPHDHVDHDPD